MKNNKLYQMRNNISKEGLLDMLFYINEFKNTKELKMIEIGSYAGESTSIFAENFKEVISIDPYINDYDPSDPACSHLELSEVYGVFIENIKKYDNIKHIRKTSDDAILTLKGKSFDFVYIDGLHTKEQVEKDINNYLPIVNVGGFIAGHDYHENWPGVVETVNNKFGAPDKIFKDTSWIICL